jgi:hypothetical protein
VSSAPAFGQAQVGRQSNWQTHAPQVQVEPVEDVYNQSGYVEDYYPDYGADDQYGQEPIGGEDDEVQQVMDIEAAPEVVPFHFSDPDPESLRLMANNVTVIGDFQ